MDCSPPGSSAHGDSPGKNIGVGCHALLQGIVPTQESQVSHMQVDSLPFEPPKKYKNFGVGSLSLFHGIFPTQELNQSLLHCRRILYQLSYQGSPLILRGVLLNVSPVTLVGSVVQVYCMLATFLCICQLLRVGVEV